MENKRSRPSTVTSLRISISKPTASRVFQSITQVCLNLRYRRSSYCSWCSAIVNYNSSSRDGSQVCLLHLRITCFMCGAIHEKKPQKKKTKNINQSILLRGICGLVYGSHGCVILIIFFPSYTVEHMAV